MAGDAKVSSTKSAGLRRINERSAEGRRICRGESDFREPCCDCRCCCKPLLRAVEGGRGATRGRSAALGMLRVAAVVSFKSMQRRFRGSMQNRLRNAKRRTRAAGWSRRENVPWRGIGLSISKNTRFPAVPSNWGQTPRHSSAERNGGRPAAFGANGIDSRGRVLRVCSQ